MGLGEFLERFRIIDQLLQRAKPEQLVHQHLFIDLIEVQALVRRGLVVPFELASIDVQRDGGVGGLVRGDGPASHQRACITAALQHEARRILNDFNRKITAAQPVRHALCCCAAAGRGHYGEVVAVQSGEINGDGGLGIKAEALAD